MNKIILSPERIILGQAPCGFGKTIVLSALIAEDKELTYLICFNKVGLIHQTIEKLGMLGAFLDDPNEIGIYNGTLNKKEINKRIVVGTVQSLIKAPSRTFDVIIFDEVHRSNMHNKKSAFYKVYKKYSPNKLIGFTATPWTMSGPIYGKEKFWNKPIYSAKTRDLIDAGRLVPLKFAPIDSNLSIKTEEIKTTAGEFNLAELNSASAIHELVKSQVTDAKQRIAEYKYPVFMGVSIEHAEMIQSELGNASIVHSKQTWKEREAQLDLFKKGKNKYLVSILVLSEGFDFPPADCLVLIRPTKSTVLFVQAVGRVLRTAPGKTHALLLDYGRVLENLGNPLDITASTHKHKDYTKICDKCYAHNEKSESFCHDCNEPFRIMCHHCFNMKVFGQKCCINTYDELEESHLEKLLKNTDLTPYSPKNTSGIFIIKSVRWYPHTSAGGNTSLKGVFKDAKGKFMTVWFQPHKGWRGSAFAMVKNLYGLPIDKLPDEFPIERFLKKTHSFTMKKIGFSFEKDGNFFNIKKWI